MWVNQLLLSMIWLFICTRNGSRRGNFFQKKIVVPSAIKKASHIIAVSENTKRDILSLFPKTDPQKITVIHEGVEDLSTASISENEVRTEIRELNDKNYFFFIGTLEPRKNINRLLRAYHRYIKKNPSADIQLVIAGKKGWKYKKIFNTYYRLKLKDKVHFVGYVSQKEKIWLLKHAFAFVFPSLYEGFGLPILEAMSLKVPIVTSNVGSIPELVIDNAVFVDPYKISSITEGLEIITENEELRSRFRKKELGMVQNLSWERCARLTEELYESLK